MKNFEEPHKAKRVLLIDDEYDFLDTLSYRLETAGLKVIVADSGKTGLEKAVAEVPDVIILDVLLPDLDGWEVCRRLRANPATLSIPVIMLTALPPVELDMTAKSLGVKKILVKSVDHKEIIRLINS